MNMIIRKGSNLRQMRNTQHLADTGNSSNFFRHLLRRNATDTGINLVEYHRSNIAAVHQHSLNRQSNTAQLAAARYLFQVIQRFAHIRTENKFQLPPSAPALRALQSVAAVPAFPASAADIPTPTVYCRRTSSADGK